MNQQRAAEDTFASVTEENTLSPQTTAVSLEQFLPDLPPEQLDRAAPATNHATSSSLRSARLLAIDGRKATIVWRGHTDRFAADVASDVDLELLEHAQRNGDAVFVEVVDDKPVIVGVMQTRLSREVHITANKILLDAAQEVVIRAGRAAIRLREDGDVELVGSRISAASRGLFRLVGRILRLN